MERNLRDGGGSGDFERDAVCLSPRRVDTLRLRLDSDLHDPDHQRGMADGHLSDEAGTAGETSLLLPPGPAERGPLEADRRACPGDHPAEGRALQPDRL